MTIAYISLYAGIGVYAGIAAYLYYAIRDIKEDP